MIIEFEGDVFRWEARTDVRILLVTVPAELGADIREIPRMPRGFGSVRVQAQIGDTSWRTSIFPVGESSEYVVPVKRAVCEAEGFDEGDVVRVRLEVLDA